MKQLQVAGFLDNSTVNGEGLRSVLFLSGCHHNCIGCHNKEMQHSNYGESIIIDDIIRRIQNNIPLIKGVTISGGEPFLQCENLLPLLHQIRSLGLAIWVYTGYTFEQLQQDDDKKQLLPLIDVLVDGPFIQEKLTHTNRYIGSSNQRILQLLNGKIIDTLYY